MLTYLCRGIYQYNPHGLGIFIVAVQVLTNEHCCSSFRPQTSVLFCNVHIHEMLL